MSIFLRGLIFLRNKNYINKMDISNICESLSAVKILIMLDDCFSVKFKEKILGELCCLQDLAYPMDGFRRISTKIHSNTQFEIFDNELDLSPQDDRLQGRGVILYMHYPTLDDNGDAVEDINKSVIVRLFNKALISFDVPVYNFFSYLNNPVTDDESKMLSMINIRNDNDYTVTLEGLVILINKDGVSVDSTAQGC